MGLTFGKSNPCPGGYDDSFTLSVIWRALVPALIPRASSKDLNLAERPTDDAEKQQPQQPVRF